MTRIARPFSNYPDIPMLITNISQISAETFDSEIVVIHFLQGTYFSVRGAGMALWNWLEQGADEATLGELLTERYGLGPDQSRTEVERFLARLKQHDLIVESPSSPAARGRYRMDVGPAGYEESVVEVFDDLQELIAIDPVHEVDPMQGWPHRPPQVKLD
jgi:hypothetical protein